VTNPNESQPTSGSKVHLSLKATSNPKGTRISEAELRNLVSEMKATPGPKQLDMASMLDYLMMKTLYDTLEPPDPTAVKKDFERFMESAQLLMKRDSNWTIVNDIDNPLVRFSLEHKPTGTTVRLNYPLNEVVVSGKAAFINRTIEEKVGWPKWIGFCKGENAGL
jgi:hypothetical protein